MSVLGLGERQDNSNRNNDGHIRMRMRMSTRTGASVDAANEMLLDFQWYSKNYNNNDDDENNSYIKCDMSHDLN